MPVDWRFTTAAQRLQRSENMFQRLAEQAAPPTFESRRFAPSPSPSGIFTDRFAEQDTSIIRALQRGDVEATRPFRGPALTGLTELEGRGGFLSPEESELSDLLRTIVEGSPGVLHGTQTTQALGNILGAGRDVLQPVADIAGRIPNPSQPFGQQETDPTTAEAIEAGRPFWERGINPLQANVLGGVAELERLPPPFGTNVDVPVLSSDAAARVRAQDQPNIIRAALGDEEEIQKGQDVLNELGLLRLPYEALFDPLNVFPGIGFTRMSQFKNALKAVTGLKGPARAKAVAKLRTDFADILSAVDNAADTPGIRLGGGTLNDARKTWWDNLSTTERKAAVTGEKAGQVTRFVPKQHDRSYRALLKTGRVNIADDAFERAGRPGFAVSTDVAPVRPEDVAFGPQETARSARTPGELRELDEFGRPVLLGEEVGDVSQAGRGVVSVDDAMAQRLPRESNVDAIRRVRNYDALTSDELVAEELRILRNKPTTNELIRGQQLELMAVRDANKAKPLTESVSQAGKLPDDITPSGASPRDSVIGKLRAAGAQAPENWLENARLSGLEFGERAGRAVRLRDELMAQGVPKQDAIRKATSELRGRLPFKATTGLDFTDAEETWFWDQIIMNTKFGQQANVEDYFRTAQRAIAAGEEVKDFPPFLWRIIEDATGVDFTNQLKIVMKERVRAVRQVAEETAAERLAKAKPPRGVTSKEPLPPEFGGEQLPIRRVAGAPEPIPPGTFAERQQFRAAMELGERAAPRAPGGARAVTTEGARAGTLREAETFPAPGVSLKEVTTPERGGLLDWLSETFGVLKPIMSSLDLSWFRQTSKTIARTPQVALQSLKKGWKAVWSEKEAVQWMDDLAAEGTTAKGYRQVINTAEGPREIGLGRLLEDRYMAVPGTPGFSESSLLKRPEFYMSARAANWFGVKQSGRGFAVGWNTNYQGMMRYWLPKLTKMNGDTLSPEQINAALNLGERLTGVGKLGKDQSWFVKALKVLGFAPGYRVSGPEAWVTLLSPKTDRLVRRMAAENLVTWATLGGSIMTAAKYGAGASVVTAIGSSQFGRIQFPGSNTFYNIWGTDQVLARAILQTISQRRVSNIGKVTPIGSGEGGIRGFLSAAKEAGTQYLQSGENPIIGLLTDIATGKNYIGEDLNWDIPTIWKEIRAHGPMAVQDIWDVTEVDGPLQAIFSIPGAIFGVGTTSYETEEQRLASAYDRYVEAGKFGEGAKPYIDEVTDAPLIVKANIQKMPDLVKLDSERNLIERAENNEIKAGLEQKFNLPGRAERFNNGEKNLGPQIMKDWGEYRQESRAAMKARVFGVDFGPESEDEKLLEAWLSINAHDAKYEGPDGAPDWSLVDIDVDEAKAALEKSNPRMLEALESVISSISPELAKLEPELEEAQRLRSDSYDIPRWKGVSVEKQREIENLHDLVGQFRDRLAAGGLDPGPVTLAQYKDAARNGGLDLGLAVVAWPLRGGDSEAAAQNPAYMKFLFDHQEELAFFYPHLYGARSMLPFLQPNIQEAVIAR